jgi:hypothetical protein
MSRVLCLLLCVSSFALAQTSNTQSKGSTTSSPVQVVYTIDGSTLTTYNLDPQTLQAAEVGTIALSESTYPYLITTPNGHFLYYEAVKDYSDAGRNLYVYDTNASGLPGTTPVQKINAKWLFGMAAHPNGQFLYTVGQGSSPTGLTPYAIVRYLIDGNNGKLSQNVTEATYHLESGTSFCSPAILGFNSAGTIMYDAVFCSYPHGTGAGTYYARSVDLQTGALGPDRQLYTWNYYAGSGGENVQFRNNLMFDFVQTLFSGNSVNIYRVQQSLGTPLVNCTSSMWTVCGDPVYGLAHPSGEYVFLFDSTTNITDIGQVNLSTQQITQTSSIPYEVQQFSPDGTVAYGVNDVNGALDIEIYGFSVASGQVTQGGTISVPSDLDSWFTAERY